MLKTSVIEHASTTLSGPPVIISFKAKPERVAAGSAVEISWEVINATSIFMEWEDNNSKLVSEEVGSISLRPILPTLYTLKANNSYGMSLAEVAVTIKKDVQTGDGAKCS